jgi:cobalt-precorrin 5A hydrolase/precorrin-3B C17-methyltransferase
LLTRRLHVRCVVVHISPFTKMSSRITPTLSDADAPTVSMAPTGTLVPFNGDTIATVGAVVSRAGAGAGAGVGVGVGAGVGAGAGSGAGAGATVVTVTTAEVPTLPAAS